MCRVELVQESRLNFLLFSCNFLGIPLQNNLNVENRDSRKRMCLTPNKYIFLARAVASHKPCKPVAVCICMQYSYQCRLSYYSQTSSVILRNVPDVFYVSIRTTV